MVVIDPMLHVSDIETVYRRCLQHCDKDVAYCILTCDNQLTVDNDINVCEHTCHMYEEYCVAHCFH